MKVLTVTPWYPHSENRASGVFVKDIAIATSKYVENTLVHIHSEKRAKKAVEVKKFRDNGILVYRISVKKLPVKLHVFLYPVVIFSLLKIERAVKPDIIHAHVFTAGVFSVLIGKLRKKPVLLTEHMKFQKKFKKGLLDRFREFLGKIVLSNADAVAVPSNFFKKYLTNLGVSNRIFVIPNAVNTEVFRKKDDERKDGTKGIFVGWLDPIKGIDKLLEAVKNLPSNPGGFSLLLVGGGPLVDYYKKLSEKYGLTDRVHFLGSKRRDEISKLLQESDFLILPSLWEVFGVVVIEAMACGKPVIVSDKGQREIVVRKTGIVVDVNDGKSLMEAIKWMIENHRKFPSNFIRNYVVRKFSFSKIGRMYSDLYRKVLSGEV